MTQLPQNEQQRLARLLIDTLIENESLTERLPEAGVNVAATLSEGQRLYDAADGLIREQNRRMAKINGLWEAIHKLHDPTWEAYRRHRTRALTVIESAELKTLLRLHDPLEWTRPTQLIQMRRFYTDALANPSVLELLEEVNLTTEKLTQARTTLTSIDKLESKLRMADAAKLLTTTQLGTALAQMNAWRQRIWKRIEIVTEDAPELRKAVGMSARG